MQADKLRELRELLAKATPGPWDYAGAHPGYITTIHAAGNPVGFTTGEAERGICGQNDDAALIAAAVNALPELLAIAEAAEDLRADAMRLDWLALKGLGVRRVNDGDRNLLVWGALLPYEAAIDRKRNLRAQIDAALSTVAPVRGGGA